MSWDPQIITSCFVEKNIVIDDISYMGIFLKTIAVIIFPLI